MCVCVFLRESELRREIYNTVLKTDFHKIGDYHTRRVDEESLHVARHFFFYLRAASSCSLRLTVLFLCFQ